MKRYIALILHALLFVSCLDEDDQSLRAPQWKKLGLDGKSINEMELTTTTLYVATTTGLFKRPLTSATNNFSSLGFDGKNVEAIQILGADKILVSIVDRTGTETPALFKSLDDGQTWAPVNANFGGETAEPLFDFAMHPSENVLYGGGFAVVAKSLDEGQTWEPVVGSWGGFATGVSVVEINPYKTNEVWVGGQGPIENGFLLRSVNESDWDTWSDLVDNPTVVKEITFTDTNPDEVLVGFEGALLKTSNSGESWETLIDSGEENKFYFGIARRPGNAQRVYAGGWLKTRDPQPLILLVSENAGKTWKEFQFPDEAYGGILEMHLISSQNHDQLFLGLDKGGVYEVTIPVK